MDDDRFDRWARGLDAALSRRGLGSITAGALATLGLVASADAKKKKKKKKKGTAGGGNTGGGGGGGGGCTPESEATTCAGKCGSVTNNCGTSVACGSCDGFDFVAAFGNGPGSGPNQLDSPYGIAIDSNGNLYVADRDNERVQKLSSAGEFIGALGGEEGSDLGQFDDPYGVAVDSNDNVYVADRNNDRIQKFDSSGTPLLEWDSESENSGFLTDPMDIAIDADDNVYVLEVFGMQVRKFTSEGVFITKFGSDGSGDGQFSFPEGIAVDGDGNVFVADTFRHRIQKFEQNEQNPLQYDFVTAWGTFGVAGDGDQEFDHPTRLAVNDVGDVFVSDRDNHRVQRFRQNAQDPLKYDLIATIGSEGEGDGELSFPEGLAFDAAGNLYVVDNLNARVQKFAPRNAAPRVGAESTRRAPSKRRGRRRSTRRKR